MALVLSAGYGQYHLTGSGASLLIPWGGDADFDWVVPDVQAVTDASSAVDANILSPQSVFRWE
jgi:hypothetical protein